MTLAIILANLCVQQDEGVAKQGTVLKMLLGRLLPLTSYQDVYKPLQASVLELFRSVLQQNRQDLLAGADLSDISIPFLRIM